MNISMRYENSPNFSSISFLVLELLHFEFGLCGHHFYHTCSSKLITIVLIELSTSCEIVHTKVNEDSDFKYAINLLLKGY